MTDFDIPQFSSVDEAGDFLKMVTDQVNDRVLKLQEEPEQLDPLVSDDDRAVVAENMLEQYHMLRTNLNIRQAIVKTLTQSYGPLSTAVQNANNLVLQAQAELDQCKYEILELMGVDS